MLSLHRNRGGGGLARRRGRPRDTIVGPDLQGSSALSPGAATVELLPIEDALDPPLPEAVPVLLSPGMSELAPALALSLGPQYAVQTDGSGEWGVMVVGPLGAAGIAFLRASHRHMRLLVVDRRWASSQPNEAVLHLEAGADGYLSSPLVAEVASHIKALVRRSLANTPTRPVPTGEGSVVGSATVRATSPR
ncbi:MAG: hypothetical protein ACRDZ8_08765 [Acidimicrobiales bacterium]